MTTPASRETAVTSPNRFLDIDGRRLAYRVIGEGKTILLCTRFRGTMDDWDPAFLNGLAANGMRVVIFDYTGLGLSTGEPSYNPQALAKDVRDLVAGLSLGNIVIAGWSLGGIVAQVVLATMPAKLSHVVLLATTPAGPLVKPSEQLFYDQARIEDMGFERQVTLFFEPTSDASRTAAKRSLERIAQRRAGRSPAVPIEFARANLGTGPRNPIVPANPILDALKATRLPILHIAGDHDIAFPVENWQALGRELPTLRLLTFPHAGHGPHHQYPEEAAAQIAAFVRTAS